MKKLLILLCVCLAFSQSACDLLGTEDKVCGDKQEGYYFRSSHGTGFFTDNPNPSYLDHTYYAGSDSVRSTIIFEKWVQHVCPGKSVKVKATISANVEGDFNVTSKGFWYIFYEQPITLTANNDGVSRIWKGDDEIGLKQAYGETGEAEFTIQATIDFPYQGSFEADTTYLFNTLQNVTLEAEYYDVK